jgi:hypothetical protein
MGVSSSGSVQIRASVAAGGALTGTTAISSDDSVGSESLCLWLNTGTGGYTLTAEGGGLEVHQLSWTVEGRSVPLKADQPTPILQAARRARCTAKDLATLAIRRTSPLVGGDTLTLVIAPE